MYIHFYSFIYLCFTFSTFKFTLTLTFISFIINFEFHLHLQYHVLFTSTFTFTFTVTFTCTFFFKKKNFYIFTSWGWGDRYPRCCQWSRLSACQFDSDFSAKGDEDSDASQLDTSIKFKGPGLSGCWHGTRVRLLLFHQESFDKDFMYTNLRATSLANRARRASDTCSSLLVFAFYLGNQLDGELTIGGVISCTTRVISWTRIWWAPATGMLSWTAWTWSIFWVRLAVQEFKHQLFVWSGVAWSTWKLMTSSANLLWTLWTEQERVVTPVNNNGLCGSCFTFESTSSPRMCLVHRHWHLIAFESAAVRTATVIGLPRWSTKCQSTESFHYTGGIVYMYLDSTIIRETFLDGLKLNCSTVVTTPLFIFDIGTILSADTPVRSIVALLSFSSTILPAKSAPSIAVSRAMSRTPSAVTTASFTFSSHPPPMGS